MLLCSLCFHFDLLQNPNNLFAVAVSRGGSRSLSVISAFDESTLLVSQFVQLVETFLGDEPYMAAFNQLVQFIQEGYMETEGERLQRLLKVNIYSKSLLWDIYGSSHHLSLLINHPPHGYPVKFCHVLLYSPYLFGKKLFSLQEKIINN